jgi:DNA-binding response OmpR family regulator
MLTAKTLVGDRVAGPRMGADDYLAQPFARAKLWAPIEALLRRSEWPWRGRNFSCWNISTRRILPSGEIFPLDVHKAWLPQKLDTPESPRHIQTVRGRGYKFSP